MLRKAAKGPGSWFKPTNLWCLRESFGLARSFVSLKWLAQAAQLRVKVMDASCQDQLKFNVQAHKLRKLLASPEEVYTRVVWSGWYAQSFVLRLDDNYRHCTANVCKIRTIYDDIGSQSQQTLKNNFQGAAYKQLLLKEAPDPTNRIRHKLASFKLGTPLRHPHVQLTVRQATPAWISEKALHSLHVLGQLVPPRVTSAVFSTMWNRWVTSRRFQQRASTSNRCVLGCSPNAEDSVEHYANCPFTQELGSRYLCLKPATTNEYAHAPDVQPAYPDKRGPHSSCSSHICCVPSDEQPEIRSASSTGGYVPRAGSVGSRRCVWACDSGARSSRKVSYHQDR